MQTGMGYDRYLTFINCQIKPGKVGRSRRSESTRFRAITISRESGSGAHDIASRLAAALQTKAPGGKRPWTVFDKELVTQVLEDHHFPARMAEFIPEDRRNELQGAIEEMFGLRPSSWTLIQHMSETILRLVELGNVILIGRGANVVVQGRKDVLHIRLTGSLEVRAARVAAARNMSQQKAKETVLKEDRGRARYLKKYLEADIDDPLLYHATFNTDLVPSDRVVELIVQLMATDTQPESE